MNKSLISKWELNKLYTILTCTLGVTLVQGGEAVPVAAHPRVLELPAGARGGVEVVHAHGPVSVALVRLQEAVTLEVWRNGQ